MGGSGALTVSLREASIPSPDIEGTLDTGLRRAGTDSKEAASETSKRKGDESADRVATTLGRNSPSSLPKAVATFHPTSTELDSSPEAIALALQTIAECKSRYAEINDYTCTFYKRERIDGKLHHPHVMSMKSRTKPSSIYFKFVTPNKGREAIFVTGKHKGKIVCHDVGLGKFFAGTMHLDPKGTMAMGENRHPITEAGIGQLIETVSHRWNAELKPEDSAVAFHPNMHVGDHACRMIESVHPEKRPEFLFHKVKLFISHETGLPIRFEAYDWPRHAGHAPELIEEYTYMNVRVNVGLRDTDFDPASPQYSFGRF
ncbi:DUF1571 domain-containing protein [Singulisphaera sp. PoT]|uniref:DUF1571 domain-containing protein n=1 Tax=Singulisphaera sp. PoT TaxID=3411797 RepID=UPI003BF4CD80